ncbi:hypothetical protein F5141DRAFT_1216885 [Pisolithus sp. B1]|nr:hypothetical protein F5141DRAFT_1216885 [Pisolithus sp. B1]
MFLNLPYSARLHAHVTKHLWCMTAGWYKDHTLRTLYQPPQDLPNSSHHPDLDSHVQMDMDVDHYDSLHPPSDQWSQGFNDDMGDIGMEVEDISDMWQSFTSIHPGCGTSFPGGSMFMDSFWQDAHTKEQRENLFYPFASSKEWQFSSWCMCLGLSMSTIDSLLSLNIIKQLSLSFQTAKELRACAESSRQATMVMQTHETGLSHQLIHQALSRVLALLKMAARIGIMMNDPVGNLRYCYTPLAAYIADTPEQSLLACTNPKSSPFTTVISEDFGDPFLHDLHTWSHTLAAICKALAKSSVQDYKAFLKACKTLHLNGVIEPWPVIKWSADTTKHAHIQEVKVPAQLSNNQNYYDQIARYLDRSDKCFHFDVTTYFETRHEGNPSEDDDLEEEHDIELDFNNCSLCDHMNLPCLPLNYFVITNALACDSIPNAPKPHCTFSNITTAFHLATKPSLCMTIDDAAILFKLPDLRPAIGEFLQRAQNHLNHPISGVTSQDLCYPLPFDHIQIWYKIHIQQFLYHKAQDIDTPQHFPPLVITLMVSMIWSY